MKTKAIISFLTEQQFESDSDKARLKAEGTLENTENGYVIEYTEPDEGMGKSLSKIEIINNKYVRLMRNGLYQADFRIEEGKTHSCTYKTPFGDMEMEIIADKVDAVLTQRGGTVYLCYRLYGNSQLIGENSLNMSIKTTD